MAMSAKQTTIVPRKFLNGHGHLDLKGVRFGLLLVLFRIAGTVNGRIRWRVQCDCGNRETIRHDYLIHKNSPRRNCVGCVLLRVAPTLKTIHNDIYHIWHAMIDRCENPRNRNYATYGGRGITVCERWHVFEAFLEDMGARPYPARSYSLDRVNPNGNYEPIHPITKLPQVRWATIKTQSRNKRKSLFLPHPETGNMVPAAEVAEYLGLSYQMMRARYIDMGKWPGES